MPGTGLPTWPPPGSFGRGRFSGTTSRCVPSMKCPRYLGLLALFTVSTACGDGEGPNLHGEPDFSAVVNGAKWTPDTAIGILYGSICDTTLFVAALRSVSPQDDEELILDMRRFPGPGTSALSDTSTGSFALFSRTHTVPGALPTTQSYWSTSTSPGRLTIYGLTTSDSLITGSFTFKAVAIPDTAPPYILSGQFRVRYTFQQVYVVSCDPPPAEVSRLNPDG